MHGKISKSHKKTISLKYQVQFGRNNLNYLMNHILYQIFEVNLSISSRKIEQGAYNPPIRVYVHKIENRITFKIKSRCYLQLLAHEMIKLIGINKTAI